MSDVLSNRNESPPHRSPPISAYGHVLWLPNVQGTANAPPGQIRAIVEPARVSEPRCRTQHPRKPNHVSLMDHGKRTGLLGPRGRPKCDARPTFDRSGILSKDRVHFQGKAGGVVRAFRSVHHTSLKCRFLLACLGKLRQSSGRRGLVHRVSGSSHASHNQKYCHHPPEGGKRHEPHAVPPLNAEEEYNPSPDPSKPGKKGSRFEYGRPHDPQCEDPSNEKSRVRGPMD